MFDKEMTEILSQINGSQIEMQTDMKWIKEKLREAAGEEGFKRCVARKAAVDTLSEDVVDIQKSFKWVRNVSVTGIIAVLVSGCGAAFHFLLEG